MTGHRSVMSDRSLSHSFSDYIQIVEIYSEITMTNLLQKFSFLATTTVLGFAVINTNPANAASVVYDFEVNNLDGILTGQTSSGFLEYDDNSLLVSDFSFNFFGENYTEADLISPEIIVDPDFLGLVADVIDTNVEFSFLEAVPAINEPAAFIYEINGQEAGGDVTYTLRSSATTPEPTTILSLLALGAVGCVNVLTKKK